jgi:hypothetical protein
MSLYPMRSRFCVNLVLGSLALILGPGSTVAGEPKRHVLDFYGEGFAFVLQEPPGWFVDTTIAREFGADVIVYPVAGDPHSSGTPVIRVVVMKKTSEDTGADLNNYVNRYRTQYRNSESRKNTATHPRYRTYGKRFCAPAKFCEYVTYLNPGPGSRQLLSVTLTSLGHPATPTTLAAYQHVVASLDTN